jgi:hypothetical protein
MRPRYVLSIWLLGLVLLTGGVALSPPAVAQAKKPIKIGFLAPLTGGAAQIGRDTVNGFEMYLEEAGQQIAGRKVELIVEDTAGNPGTAITKFRKLVARPRSQIESTCRGRMAISSLRCWLPRRPAGRIDASCR